MKFPFRHRLNNSDSASNRFFGNGSLLNPNVTRKSCLELSAKKLQVTSKIISIIVVTKIINNLTCKQRKK